MAKRFIDTGLFDDPWFMDLSKDGKIFWVYLITKCNHAGIIELNERLFKFQTGLKCMQTVIKELGNRLVGVRDQYFFVPKFLDFQYPNFPNSKVKSQKSAIDILEKFNIDINNYQTVSEPLDKGYENETEYDNGNETENEKENELEIWPTFEDFWNAYDKKIGSKQNCKKKFDKLNQDIKEQIMNHIFVYVKATPDKQYRVNPETFFNQKRWENEIIENNGSKKQKGFTEAFDKHLRDTDPNYQNY
jgi:hypothetical protein